MSRPSKILTVFVSLSVFWVVSAPRFARWLIVEKKIKEADVIFVLAGSAAYRERTRKAAAEYKAGVSRTVLLSDDGERAGWSESERKNPKFVELASRSLQGRGVPEGSIVVMKAQVNGTIDEAAGFRNIALSRGWRSVLIVTSSYHTRRALKTFERSLEGTGTEVGVTAPTGRELMPPENTWWLTPAGWRYVGGEYLKSAYYWLFY